MPAGVWIGQVFQYFSGFVTISFEKTAIRIPLWSQKNNLEQKKVFLWKLQPRPWGFLISFFVSDICYKKGDRSPGDHVARVNEIFNSRPVWMFLKINFRFEIMTLCGREIFQGIFSINSRKPLLHSDIWSLLWTLIPLWFRMKCIRCSCQFPLTKFSKTHVRRLSHSLCSRLSIVGNSFQNLFNDRRSWAKASYFTDSEHWTSCS